MINFSKIDSLKQGLQTILSEHRSWLSDDDVFLLEECVSFLETVKTINNPLDPESIRLIILVIEILLKFFN